MKGVVFSEFIEMVESKFSMELADRIIMQCDLPSEGAYTSVGTYDHREILSLVRQLSEETSIPSDTLLTEFGRYMFGRFFTLYPFFFEGITNSYEFLSGIEEHVHAEVRKLYTDTELPSFDIDRPDDNTLVMVYRSRRPFAQFANGLIHGCIQHYDENISVEMEDLSEGDTSHVRFTLKRH